MVSVRMGYQYRIESRKLVDSYSGRSNPPQDTGEGRIKIRVRENSLPTDLEKKRRMPDVGDTDSFGGTRIGIRQSGGLVAR